MKTININDNDTVPVFDYETDEPTAVIISIAVPIVLHGLKTITGRHLRQLALAELRNQIPGISLPDNADEYSITLTDDIM